MPPVDGRVSQQVLSDPPRVLGLVMEWGKMHQSKLMENWTTLAKEGIFRRIVPLVSGD